MTETYVSSPDGVTDAGRYDHLVQEDRVHASLYTDPKIFAEEMSKIYGGTWIYLAHESEIPNPHDFRLGNLGLRPLIITRDADGGIRALFNRCAHRGARVCREQEGTAKRFTCGYHNWTYNNTGKLVSLTEPEGYGPDFNRSDFSLAQVPRVESYRGFIFATMNMDAPSLTEHLGLAAEKLDLWIARYPEGSLTVKSSAQRMVYEGNWKLSIDNGGDNYHVAYSHKSLLDMVKVRGYEGRDMQYYGPGAINIGIYNQDLGRGHTFIDQRPGMDSGYWQWVRPMPGMEPTEALLREKYGDAEAERLLEMAPGANMNHVIYPNLMTVGNQIQVVEPLAVNRTQLSWYGTTIAGAPEEFNTLRMRMQEDFQAFGEPDDMANFEECQRGLEIAEIEWVNISRGLGTDRHTIDDRGALTGPAGDELTLRAYFREWKRLMEADVCLSLG